MDRLRRVYRQWAAPMREIVAVLVDRYLELYNGWVDVMKALYPNFDPDVSLVGPRKDEVVSWPSDGAARLLDEITQHMGILGADPGVASAVLHLFVSFSLFPSLGVVDSSAVVFLRRFRFVRAA